MLYLEKKFIIHTLEQSNLLPLNFPQFLHSTPSSHPTKAFSARRLWNGGSNCRIKPIIGWYQRRLSFWLWKKPKRWFYESHLLLNRFLILFYPTTFIWDLILLNFQNIVINSHFVLYFAINSFIIILPKLLVTSTMILSLKV